MLDTQSLVYSLYKINAIQFGEFKLKNGEMSPIYINLRKIISYPSLLRDIATLMWEKTHTCQFDLICGVPYTALPIATCLSLLHNIPMIMRRKEKKDYGTKQMIEGEFSAGQRCLIIEDVVTTGSSIIETANDLENVGLKITDVIAVLDREQGGKTTLMQHYHLQTLVSLSDMLRILLGSDLLTASQHVIVDQFLLEKFC